MRELSFLRGPAKVFCLLCYNFSILFLIFLFKPYKGIYSFDMQEGSLLKNFFEILSKGSRPGRNNCKIEFGLVPLLFSKLLNRVRNEVELDFILFKGLEELLSVSYLIVVLNFMRQVDLVSRFEKGINWLFFFFSSSSKGCGS